MNPFEEIIQLLTPTEQADSKALSIVVKCQRCREVIRARVDLHNDLSIDKGEVGLAY